MPEIINLYNSINKYFSNLLETKYLENIILDKNYNIIFDHTINFNGYFVNGLIYNKKDKITIKINPYSTKSILFILIHELTHVIDKNKLKDLVINYIINELELLEDNYMVSDELICDIAGLLLGNTKFLDYLYNNGNYNINNINNYNIFINKFRIIWEYCYKNNILSITEETYYEMVNDPKYGSYWKIDDSKDIFKNEKDIKKLQIKVANYIKNNNVPIINPLNNQKILFINASAKEYIYGKQSQLLSKTDINYDNYYQNKLRLIMSLDDLIKNSTIKYSSPLKHPSKLFPNGFDKFSRNSLNR